MTSSIKNSLALIGFGSQGKAWALNLRDSGHEVDIYLKANSQKKSLCEKLDFKTFDLNTTEALNYNFVLLLIPDHEHLNFLKDNAHKIPLNTTIIYAHGFSVATYKLNEKFSHLNHALLAPKAIASEVRFQYETKGKLLGVYSLLKNSNSNIQEQDILTLGKAIGLTSLFKSNFTEETKADLFSEQALLCSLIPYGSKLCFEKLVASGIDPKLALLECYLELRSISKAFVDLGPEAFFNLISPNALIGSEIAYKKIFDEDFQKKLDSLWNDIDSERFQNLPKDNTEMIRKEVIERFNTSPLAKTFNELKDLL